MKIRITKRGLRNTLHIGFFVLAVALVFYLLPQKQRFRYQFDKNRPWQYELLTSPYDFPILKSEERLKKERDSVMLHYAPYFRKNDDVIVEKIDAMSADNNIDAATKTLLKEALQEIYRRGIIGIEDKTMLDEMHCRNVFVIDGIKTQTVSANSFFTNKSAYEYLDSMLFHGNNLKFLNLGRFLTSNLIYDKVLSEKAKEDLLATVSLSEGMVQKGERIIGPGEVVDETTFMILSSLKNHTERQELSKNKEYVMIFGEIVFVTGILLLFAFYLRLFRPKIAVSNKNLLFMLIMIVSMVALAALVVKHTSWSIYLVPFALQPIIVRIFFDSRTALFTHIITILLVSYVVPAPLEFIVLQITAGMTAVSSLKNLTQRSQLVRTASLIFLSYAFMYTACVLMLKGDFLEIEWKTYINFLLNSFMLLFAYGLIFLFEKAFGFLSDITLVELSNVNNKLLLRFAETAPGTFQHSLQVANLATEAAKSINANVLLTRTGALYHDIGKMEHPMYFTENQLGNNNPLAQKEFEDAAKIIISHVADGVKIAEKNDLPSQVIDFIRTHHGKSKTRFFYNSFKNKYPDRPINEEAFSYKGPLPNTKETAVVMMADAVEATSKSLPEHSEESIDKTVEKVIDNQIAEGAFKNAPITFRHIEQVKAVFKEKLKNIYHVRISYPELEKKQENDSK